MFDNDTYNALRRQHIAEMRAEPDGYGARKALKKMRAYLDATGMLMPRPRWLYCTEDVGTWRFLEGGSNCTKSLASAYFRLNPKFRYAHLTREASI